MSQEKGKGLPTVWRIEKLGDVCDFLDSRRVPLNEAERAKRIAGKKPSELYPYYGANGQIGWIDGYLFDEPLVLLAEDGGFFGSPSRSIAYTISGKTWVNNHAHVLRPKDGIDIHFLAFALSIRPDVGDMVMGNTRPKLNQRIAKEIPVPFPSLSEQKRIAAILAEQLAAVERARKAAQEQLNEIENLPASLLRQAFSGSPLEMHE
uniref:Type I restriction modification DNA specificity domain-containing protein n=1 Tax=Candidatus Kentrum sp. LFY TaxID=2126342 RepID=A0A450V1A4_9GAMM|nr:MAG: Type I restriction modification DNA specificity domain-containing protein [Candidatus Kentron sp. LFY]VFJ98577.1 MAG: Type I restriction modification DNA specificity domain-containing protein [Candidatus Kentron sp. LFY]